MSEIAIKFSTSKGAFHLEVDSSIPDRGVTGVFGESGSGKTTLLRCLAGLESCNQTPGDKTPVHRRNVGYVFQEPRLFSHLNVRRNIEYGQRRNRQAGIDQNEHFRDVVALLDLDNLLDRATSDLSGGEAQRVSIARALCASPRLILMDEPLSGLDERRKAELLPYLDRLHAETELPIVYVSHNIDEICRLSDHLLILAGGQIVAEGPIQQTLSRLDLPQLSGRNAGAMIAVSQTKYDEKFDLTLFGFSGGELWVPGKYAANSLRLRVAASDVSLCRVAAEATTILNTLPAVIEEIVTETPATVLVRLKLGEDSLVSRITLRSREQLALRVGDNVYAQVKSVTVRH